MIRSRSPKLRAVARAIACAALLQPLLLVHAPAAVAQDAHLARNLAATCANCHGTNGHARGDMKPLAGMDAERMAALVAGYRSGALPSTVMGQIAKGYSDDQIRLVAGYLAAQPAAK